MISKSIQPLGLYLVIKMLLFITRLTWDTNFS
nr:MAG TPA: hypothetical protein [Caudoviricetes sp.]